MKHNGYDTTKGEPYVHRARAYHIYLENRKKYPLPYTAYEVHHIDFNKDNNKVSNLQILTPSEHDKLHEEQKKKEEKRKKKELKLNEEKFRIEKIEYINSKYNPFLLSRHLYRIERCRYKELQEIDKFLEKNVNKGRIFGFMDMEVFLTQIEDKRGKEEKTPEQLRTKRTKEIKDFERRGKEVRGEIIGY